MTSVRNLIATWQFKVGYCVLVVVVLVLFFRSNRQETPERAVLNYIDCVYSMDASCVASYTGEYESSMGSPTAAQWDRFFLEVYKPALAGFEPVEAPEFDKSADPEVLSNAALFFRHADGRLVDMGVAAYVTNERPAVFPNFISVLFTVFQTYRGPREEITINELWLRALNELEPKLTEIGIRGVYANDNFEGHFYTWSQWRAKLHDSINRSSKG